MTIRPSHRRRRCWFVSPLIFLLLFSPVFRSASGGPAAVVAPQKRPDPLNHFTDYAGGYDVQNKHYWASAAFSGAHGYLMATTWLLLGLCFGLSLVVNNAVAPTRTPSSLQYLLFFLACLLTLLVVLVGTTVVIIANRNFVDKTKRLRNTIEEAGNDVARAIRSTINAMTRDGARNFVGAIDPTPYNVAPPLAMTPIQYLLLPYDPTTSRHLNITNHKLGRESRSVQYFVRQSRRAIDTSLHVASVSHVVVATLNFIFLLAAFVLIFLHWPPGFIAIIISWWILTALFCVLTSFDCLIHTFADDTCSALEDYVRHPYSNSLSDLLPCMNRTIADKALKGVSSIIHDFITQLNLKITEVSEELASQGKTAGNLRICDPFSGPPSFKYEPQACPNDSLPIGELPNMLAKFTCKDQMNPKICEKRGKFIPEYAFLKASAYSNSVQEILNMFPDLQSLTHCRKVNAVLSDVVSHECRPFKVSTRLQWKSMLSLSVCMMACVLTLLFRCHQERGRSFSRWSIYPTEQTQGNERVGEIQGVRQPIQ